MRDDGADYVPTFLTLYVTVTTRPRPWQPVGGGLADAVRRNVQKWLILFLTLALAKRPLPAMEADITRWWPVY